MLIKCPQCSATNEVQKFCGNCGSKLLIEGAELDPNKKVENKNDPKRKNRWFLGIGLFLAVWILGDVILSFFAGYAGLNERYVGAITFILGLVVLWEVTRNKDEVGTDETVIK